MTDTASIEIQRYACRDSGEYMDQYDDGDFVYYADHAETVQQFQEQIRLLENDKVRLIAWREQSDNARLNEYTQNQRLRDQVQQLQRENADKQETIEILRVCRDDIENRMIQSNLDNLNALQDLRAEIYKAMSEASHLAMGIWRTHYQKESPNFELCNSVSGVISQIDNMYAGLRAELAAAKQQLAEAKTHIHKLLMCHYANVEKADEHINAAYAFCRSLVPQNIIHAVDNFISGVIEHSTAQAGENTNE